MEFTPVSLNNLDRIYGFTSVYGEGSCQHSPVSMFSLYGKYGDAVYTDGDFLYVLREHLCDDDYRVYMSPFGGGDLKAAYDRILEDAHSYGRKACFISLTAKHASFLEKEFSGHFEIKNDRDLAEYIYDVTTMRDFPGKLHARRRTEIRSFWRDYGERTAVSKMTDADLDEVLDFAEEWLGANAETHDKNALDREMVCIRRQIDNFNRLHITGTVIRIDGRLSAFCYGTPLNGQYYDVLIEKGDRAIPGI